MYSASTLVDIVDPTEKQSFLLPVYVNCVRNFWLGFIFDFSEDVVRIIRNI
jgi:hypothetical protein